MTGSLEIARGLLAEAVGQDRAVIEDSAAIGALETWDSLAHMRLVLAVEERIGTTLTPQEVFEIMSLADVARLLGRHV